MEQRKILGQYLTGIFKRYPILKTFNQKLQRKISKSVTLTSMNLKVSEGVGMVQH